VISFYFLIFIYFNFLFLRSTGARCLLLLCVCYRIQVSVVINCGGVEDTKLSTNKQHTHSLMRYCIQVNVVCHRIQVNVKLMLLINCVQVNVLINCVRGIEFKLMLLLTYIKFHMIILL
jgi:hypothetical protein